MGAFLREVNERIGGIPIERCYHCRKCTVGCPLVFAMDYSPDTIIRMIQLGRKEQVLKSFTIWLCVSCETCFTRCPNEVDVARMMDVLREMAVLMGYGAKEKNILRFHQAFLTTIRRRGRINEPLLMVLYKIRAGDFFSDLSLGLKMFFKGKLPLLSPKVRERGSLKNLFIRAKQRVKKGGGGA